MTFLDNILNTKIGRICFSIIPFIIGCILGFYYYGFLGLGIGAGIGTLASCVTTLIGLMNSWKN